MKARLSSSDNVTGWYQTIFPAKQTRKKDKEKKKEKEKNETKQNKQKQKNNNKKRASVQEMFRETHPAMLAEKRFQACEPNFHPGSVSVCGAL